MAVAIERRSTGQRGECQYTTCVARTKWPVRAQGQSRAAQMTHRLIGKPRMVFALTVRTASRGRRRRPKTAPLVKPMSPAVQLGWVTWHGRCNPQPTPRTKVPWGGDPLSGKSWPLPATRQISAVAIGSIALLLIAAVPALAASVVTDPEPDLSCPGAYGSGDVTDYVTTVDTPSVGEWRVTVTFTLDGGSCDLTLATYELSSPSFTLPQELYDSMSGTFGPGTHTLTATLPREADEPGCFSQYDFAFGPAIEALTGSEKYGDRLIRARIVGSETCNESAATPTPTPTPEQTLQPGTPTPNPTLEEGIQGGSPTPAPSQPDTAMGSDGRPNPVPTVGFGLLLLGSLVALIVANVKASSRG
jgi:hypothetical protein